MLLVINVAYARARARLCNEPAQIKAVTSALYNNTSRQE